MNYKKQIAELMIPEKTLDQAVDIFRDFQWCFLRHLKRSPWEIFKDYLGSLIDEWKVPPYQMPLHALIENDETLTEAYALRSAAEIFLKVLPDEMEPMPELDRFLLKINFCKGTLELCMKGARASIAKMR